MTVGATYKACVKETKQGIQIKRVKPKNFWVLKTSTVLDNKLEKKSRLKQ